MRWQGSRVDGSKVARKGKALVPYSQLRSQPRIPLAEAAPLPAPLTIYAELSNRCNLACRMCPESLPGYHDSVGGKRTMSLADLELLTEQIAGLSEKPKSLYLHSLGEPMLNPHCADFIRMVRPYVEKICLTTNGTVPLTKLLDCPPDYVRVSVYGISQDEFERVTQSKVDHRRVLENVRALWLNRQAREQELPFIYVKGFGKFSVLHHRFHGVCDEVDVEPTMNWNGEKDWQTSLDGITEPSTTTTVSDHTQKRVCPAPFYMLNVHASLEVSACGVDWSKRLVVGDLRKDSLQDIWHGERLRQIQMLHLQGERCKLDGCRRCTYLDTTLPDDMDSLTAEEYTKRRNPPQQGYWTPGLTNELRMWEPEGSIK